MLRCGALVQVRHSYITKLTSVLKKKKSLRALQLPSHGMPSKICLVLARISFICWISGRVHTASHVVVMADRVLIFLFFKNAAAHLATPRGASFEKHWLRLSHLWDLIGPSIRSHKCDGLSYALLKASSFLLITNFTEKT